MKYTDNLSLKLHFSLKKTISLSNISQAQNGFRNVKLWLFHAAAYVRFLIRIETFALGQNLAADFDLNNWVIFFLKFHSYVYWLVFSQNIWTYNFHTIVAWMFHKYSMKICIWDELLEACRHRRKHLFVSLFDSPSKKEPPDTTIK